MSSTHPNAVEHATPSGLLDLPTEILLQILSFFGPAETTSLQLTCKQLLNVCRDSALWKSRCFDESSFLASYEQRKQLLSRYNEQRAAISTSPDTPPDPLASKIELAGSKRKERVRLMENWDPSFPGENVNWYDEFIQRTAPAAVNWLQQPLLKDGSETTAIEARGLALYRPDGEDPNPHTLETVFAVSPLDDGSVCLWDVTGAKRQKGAIAAKSRPGILFIDGPSENGVRPRRIDSGFAECVSIDNKLHRAFFAVQSRLVEVDLRRLSVVDVESFPWVITALSSSDPRAPLTVGTSNGIHLYDFRARPTLSAEDYDRLEGITAQDLYERNLKAIFDDKPLPPYAPLAHPVPLSILHMQRPGAETDVADEIFVAGRFPSILLYDRRMFPSIKGSIHSGARLSSLASLPYPYSTLDSELRRDGQMSLEQIQKSKTTPVGGRTLLACGEYNTKGSLEMYGLQPSLRVPTSLPGGLSNSVFKNRYSSSDSKLLSGITQGTRLVVSDGSGRIKWFERDGCTEVRRVTIGHCEPPHHHNNHDSSSSLFGGPLAPGSADDLAKKLLATGGGDVNGNDILFWTGEHLGMVTFTSSPGFSADSFEEEVKTAVELEKERAERQYSENMRRALERQADDVRFVRNLGLGV